MKRSNQANKKRKNTSRKISALSLRQPFAERVMQGRKKKEYRSMPTHKRERVYIYASKTLADIQWSRAELKRKLPTGVLVGTVEIVDCRPDRDGGYWWILANPDPYKRLRKPRNMPQPVFFFPF